jgi:flagellar basal-body rod protein FlgF
MSRTLDVAAAGMELQALRHDILANNLANAATTGFKPDALVTRSFKAVMEETAGRSYGAAGIVATRPRFEQGDMVSTGNPLDFALEGDGFLAVMTPEGERYTRAGACVLDDAKQITTPDGFPVLGKGGPVTVNGTDITITGSGEIIVDGALVDELRIVDFEKPYALHRTGRNMYVPDDDGAVVLDKPAATRVNQGFIESSAVDAVSEMVRMIEVLRAFEANQKAVSAWDEMMQRGITVARL